MYTSKKTFVWVLIIAMCLALAMSGCAQNNRAALSGSAPASSGPSAAGAQGAGNSLPISKDGAKISISCADNYYSAAPTSDTLPVWAWVKEQTGHIR